MSLNWSTVKSLAIPVGGVSRDVKRVSIGGEVVWKKPSPLPYDAEVEYLESTGTQWIDTGVDIANSDDARFVTTCTITNTVSSAQSTWVGSGVLSTGGLHYVLDQYGIRTGGGTATNAIPYNRGDAVTIDVYYDSQHRRTCKIGQSIYQGTAYNAQTAKLAILNYPAPTGVTSHSLQTGKLFHVEVYKSGNLVRDYIPVRKGTVGYLYDRVSGALFGNAGTGDFVVGPDVVPVEYIESHGTEWIDTGVVATNSHGFRVDVATAQKSGNVNTRIFGVHEGNVRCGFALYGTTAPSGNDLFWGWDAATGFVADIPQRFVVSLNYKNDRAAIFDGTTNLSSLGTLGNTTKSIYLLNANYNGAPFVGQYVIGRLYKAEISIGSDISNNFIPVRVGSGSAWEGAMMDVLTRRIYRNAGTGAFTYGNDLPYPIGG